MALRGVDAIGLKPKKSLRLSGGGVHAEDNGLLVRADAAEETLIILNDVAGFFPDFI